MKEYVPYLVENGLIPICLAIIEGVVTFVYKKKTDQPKKVQNIKRLIRKAVNETLPKNIDHRIRSQLVDAIFNELPYYSTSVISDACQKIISVWPDMKYVINSTEIANNVTLNLASYFYETPEFRVLILINDNKTILNELQENKRRFDAIEKKIDLIPETLEDAMKSCKLIQQMSRNSLAIADEYQSYFSKELFLERNQPDNKIVYLKDVYIENEFIPLDLYKTKIDVSLIGFIEEFANDNVLRKYYRTRYATDTGILKLLIVKGQPGSGKSSLFYALAHKKTHDVSFLPGISFYFIKLIELYSSTDSKPSANPLSDIMDYLQISLPKGKSVFVLDGLDEICALTGFDSGIYCNNLTREACKHRNIKVVLTTRLNYVNVSHEDNKNVFNIQLNPLSDIDLKKWVEAYFSIHTELKKEKKLALRNIKYIQKYKANKKGDIKEIVAIPLLFYMIVATSIDIQSLESVGQLYDMVFSELKSRHYNENEASYIQSHAANDLLKNELPRRVAMSIATIMYKNNDPLIEINSTELEKTIVSLQNEYHLNKKEKENLEKLFPITFYYKKRDDVVEFAHRSIIEFFAAEQLFTIFCACKMDLLDYVVNYMAKPVVWGEVVSFFSYFWNTRKDDKVVNYYSKTLENDFKRITSPSVSLQVSDSSYSYEANYLLFKIFWFLAHDILGLTNQLNSILKQDYYKIYLSNILSVKSTEVSTFFDQLIHPWNFSGIMFYDMFFEGGNLYDAVFDKTKIEKVFFDYFSLDEASFNGASIRTIDFRLCRLNNILFMQDEFSSFVFKNCSLYQISISTKLSSKPINLKYVEDLINDKSIYNFIESKMSEVSFHSVSFSNVKILDCINESIILKKVLISFNDFCTYWERGVLTQAEDIILDLRGLNLNYDEEKKKAVYGDRKEITLKVKSTGFLNKNSSSVQILNSGIENLVPISEIDVEELNRLVGKKFKQSSIKGEIYFLF